MIRTITNWPTISATQAAITVGRRRIGQMGAEVVGPSAVRLSVSRSASSNGSGRRSANDRTAARPTNRTGTRYGPDRGGSPAPSAIAAEIGHQLGAEDGADRGRPDHDADRRRAPGQRHHVRVGVARQLVRGVPEADQQRPAQQQRERGPDHGQRRDRGRRGRPGHSPGRARRGGRGGPCTPTAAPSRWRPRARPSRPGAPASSCEPSISLATIVATVTAAMCPVLPSATPVTSVPVARRRAACSWLGDRSAGTIGGDGAHGGRRYPLPGFERVSRGATGPRRGRRRPRSRGRGRWRAASGAACDTPRGGARASTRRPRRTVPATWRRSAG